MFLSFAVFNLVDPYGVFDWSLVKGFNDIKPQQSSNARVVKPFVFLQGDYNGLVLGASRELRGMDPQSPFLRHTGYRFYNFSLVEQRPYESEEIAKFAVGRRSISTIVIDLDFTRYNLDPALLDDRRPYYPKGPILPWALEQYLRASISLQGLADCYDTIVASRQAQPVAQLTVDGAERAPDYVPGLGYDYQGHFARGLAHYLNTILPQVASVSPDWMRNGFDHTPLRDMIDLAAVQHIRFMGFIAPDHALQMEALRRKGLWPVFERWKEELVEVFHSEAMMHPDTNLTLWDFSGYNAMTTEPLPRSPHERRAMDYWDEVHYAAGMGDRIMAALFQLPNGASDRDDFGVKLTPENIQRHLAEIRADQAAYESAHGGEIKWLASLDRPPQ